MLMKKTLTAAVSFAAIAVALSSFADTKKIGSYTWSYTTIKGGVRLEGNMGGDIAVSPKPVGYLAIPEKIGKLAVKEIGASAFRGCDELVSVKIPKGVTKIGSSAFRECTGLKAVTVPSTVKSIEIMAFQDCTSLESIAIPKGVTGVAPYTFCNCFALRAVSIPSTVKTIGDSAFSGCESLVSTTLAHVDTIAAHAFEGSALVTIGTKARLIDSYAFLNCRALMSVNLLSGASVIGENAFDGCTKLEILRLSHSVSAMGFDAFNATNIKQVYYEYDGEGEIPSDEERFSELLAGSGMSADKINAIEFSLWCNLTVKSNNTKYGTAVILDEDDSYTSSRWPADEEAVLLAKPKKGYVFAGWYQDKALKKPLNDDFFWEAASDYRQKRLSIAMPRKHTTIYAKFVSKAADKKALKFSSSAKKLAKTVTKAYPDSCLKLKVGASSASLPSYSAKGLPSGLKIDSETGEIYGTPTKPGSFTATVTVKSAGGYKVVQKVKITVYAYNEVWGQYVGYARPSAKASEPPANLTFSINGTGKVAGKVIWKDKSYSFTAQCSYSTPDMTKFSPSIKIDKKTTFKPGVIEVYGSDMGDASRVRAVGPSETLAFVGFKRSYLLDDGGMFEELIGDDSTSLTEALDVTDFAKASLSLKALFGKGDRVTLAGTIGGKPVNTSAQLSLKSAYDNGFGAKVYEMAVPVIFHKYKYYRAFIFHFVRNSDNSVSMIAPVITEIDDMLY